MSQVRLAHEQGLLTGDMHAVGVLSLMLAVQLSDSFAFKRDDFLVRSLLGIPYGEQQVEQEEEESADDVFGSADEFRAAMDAIKRQAAAEDGEQFSEWE